MKKRWLIQEFSASKDFELLRREFIQSTIAAASTLLFSSVIPAGCCRLPERECKKKSLHNLRLFNGKDNVLQDGKIILIEDQRITFLAAEKLLCFCQRRK